MNKSDHVLFEGDQLFILPVRLQDNLGLGNQELCDSIFCSLKGGKVKKGILKSRDELCFTQNVQSELGKLTSRFFLSL